MASVRIANLWNPAIFLGQVVEQLATYPIIINSGVVVRPAKIVEAATGAGTAVNIPTWADISDQADEVQVEATAPTTTNGITAGLQVCVPLNRVCKSASEALAAQVSGGDPVQQITAQIGIRRLKQRQTILISILRGLFGTSSGVALNTASALSPCRLNIASETGASPSASAMISPAAFIAAKALMGELGGDLASGALFMHTNVRATLENLDANSFKTGIQSGLPFNVTTYRGVPVFTCDALFRAGTTSGFVYDSYIIGQGVIGTGEKPQIAGSLSNPVVDVASLNFTANTDTNSELILDRTRSVIHANGTKWIGTPAGQSPTNPELGTLGNWGLVFQTANRVGIACIQSNG